MLIMWPKCDLRTETYLLEPPLEAAGGEDGIWEGATGKGGRFLKNVRGLLKPTFFILCKGSQQPRGIRNGVKKKGGELVVRTRPTFMWLLHQPSQHPEVKPFPL